MESNTSSSGEPTDALQQVTTQARRSRRSSIRYISIAVVVIAVALIAGCIIMLFTPLSPFISTPQKTLDSACKALKNSDYHALYHLLSKREQANEPEGQAVANAQQNIRQVGGIKNCTVSDVGQNGNLARGTMAIILGQRAGITSQQVLLIQEGGMWKINSLLSTHAGQ